MNTDAYTRRRFYQRASALVGLFAIITAGSMRLQADTGTCGGQMITLPFTDVPGTNIFFCSIAEAYFSGLTNGTTPTTYSPTAPVPRDQMAAFVTRTMDQSLKRGSRRATLDQYWTPSSADDLRLTTVGTGPELVKSDGSDLWVANATNFSVSRVRASDGKLLETWFGAVNAFGVLAAKGLIFVTGSSNPGQLHQIDPTQPATSVTTLPINLGAVPMGISFDGTRIWTANKGAGGFPGSVSIVTLNPLSVNTVTTGFSQPTGILYDGTNIWVCDSGFLFKLDSNGAIIQTVTVFAASPVFPVFDGTNIWVPSQSNTITVVRASTGAIVATLSGNGLLCPFAAAFDGERILVTNGGCLSVDGVTLWKAASLTPLGSFSTGVGITPTGVCSDGLNFWITLNSTGKLARF